MHPRKWFVVLLVLSVFSCNDHTVYSEYKATEGVWNKDDVMEFSIADMDTLSQHHLFFNVRNDNTFPFSNLFLIAELAFPNGETVKDTLEYEMALPDGTWLGKGQGSLKENKLWYKENIVFPVKGVYTLKVSHAMRKNGSAQGIMDLRGITDVGIQIEKIKK